MADEAFLLSSAALAGSSAGLASGRAVSYTTQPKQTSRVVVLNPAVGLTIYDSADQTPLSSITLGPSFHPTSSPASRSEPSSSTDSIRVKAMRRTWVGVEASGSNEVWCWTEFERKDGSIEGEPTKLTFPVEGRVSEIAAPRSLPSQVVLLSATGQVSLASDSTLESIASTSALPTPPSSQSLHLFPITPSTSTSFLPPALTSLIPASSTAHLALLVRSFPATAGPSMVEIAQKKVKKSKRPSAAHVIEEAEAAGAAEGASGVRSEVEVILIDGAVDEQGEKKAYVKSLGKVEVGGNEVVVSEEGFVTALASDGSLSCYRLTLSAPTVSAYPELFAADTIISLGLTPVRSLALSTTSLSLSSIALVALHSSFVLLASIRPFAPAPGKEDSAPTVTALVWDVRLGAVVSSTDISIPAAAFPPSPNAPRKLLLALSLASRTTAALAVAPSSGSTGRSLLYLLPLASLPSASVLAAVVGKHALTRRFLAQTESVAAKAKRTEPVRHPRTSPGKLALLETSERERAALLDKLERVLAPLADAKASADAVDGAVGEADRLFAAFTVAERERLTAYNLAKVTAAEEKEKERRNASLIEKDRVDASTKKYRLNRKKIDAAIAEADKEGISWVEVTAKRIKGVNDKYRYKYYELRKQLEEALGKKVEDPGHERRMRAIERQEPNVPSTFVTAVLKLCFPVPFTADADISASPAAAERVFKHPVGIVASFLERGLVGDGLIEGGVTRHLARANDWSNVQRALEAMPDVPESTTVSLLKTVVTASLTADPSDIEVETVGLPFPIPALATFLASFVESPSTPAILRQQLQRQLTAVEALPLLEVLDEWLGWWVAHGGGGGEIEEEGGKDWKSEGKPKPKRLPTNPFVALTLKDAAHEPAPPRVEDIVPLVQSLLDAHFVTLLLQRHAHRLLRRLAAHVAAHVALSADLASLLGALAIYARAKEEQKEAALAAKEGLAKAGTGMGRDLGASMAARVAAQELHAEVGEYQVDRFYL